MQSSNYDITSIQIVLFLSNPFRTRSLSGSAANFAKNEAPIVDLDKVISDPKQIQHQQQLSDTISIPVEVCL